VFLILVRRLRPVAVAVALSFHVGTYLLMKIQFWSLVLNFVTFVDWDRLLRRLGLALFPRELRVEYDGGLVGHRRRVAALRVLDVLHRVDYVDAGRDAHPAGGEAAQGTPTAWPLAYADADVAASPRVQPAWGAAVLRTPLAWPFAPLLLLIPAGREVQNDADDAAAAPAVPAAPGFPRVAAATFSALLFGNIVFGLKGARDGWPLTCYPTFSRVIGPEIRQTDVIVRDGRGDVIEWDGLELRNRFSKSRYAAMMKLMGEERDPRKMRAFWKVLSSQNPRFADARRVEFYDVLFSTEPGPHRRELARTKVWETDPTIDAQLGSVVAATPGG
jgi:hypothetical protein